MARDIEEFLRKAAERRNQQQKQQPASSEPPRRPVATPPARPTAPIQDVEVVESRESVERHVQRYVNTSQIAEHTKHLAEEVSQADEKMEDHLKEVFEHQVGQLTKNGGSNPPGSPKSSAKRKNSDLIAMMRNPKQFRNAIIVAEILKRPEY